MLGFFKKTAHASVIVAPQSLNCFFGEMPLEELRQKILEQRRHNFVVERLNKQGSEAILAILSGKMRRRGVSPHNDSLELVAKVGIEQETLKFKYKGGFFTAIFLAYWNCEENCIEISVQESEHVSPKTLGYVVLAGERYLYR